MRLTIFNICTEQLLNVIFEADDGEKYKSVTLL